MLTRIAGKKYLDDEYAVEEGRQEYEQVEQGLGTPRPAGHKTREHTEDNVCVREEQKCKNYYEYKRHMQWFIYDAMALSSLVIALSGLVIQAEDRLQQWDCS